MAISPHFVADDRDGRREHEDEKAHGHADAGQRRDDRDRNDSSGREQQPQMEGIEASNQVVVERVNQSEKDTDRHRDGEHGREWADMRLVLDEIGGDMKACAGGDDGGDDHHLGVAPDEGPIAVRVEDRRRRQQVVDPPHAEGEPGARDADERRIQGPTLLLDDRRQCRDRAHDPLAQRNDGEETVALGNVMSMPGCASILALGE